MQCMAVVRPILPFLLTHLNATMEFSCISPSSGTEVLSFVHVPHKECVVHSAEITSTVTPFIVVLTSKPSMADVKETVILFLLSLCALTIIVHAIFGRRRNSYNLPYPPGPPPKFIIGNYFDVPKEHPHLEYVRWSKAYSSQSSFLSTVCT